MSVRCVKRSRVFERIVNSSEIKTEVVLGSVRWIRYLTGMARKHRPHTPDGRYLVSKGIFKRCTNPELDDATRRRELKTLMQARMIDDRAAALRAKEALGEAGAVWWDDGAPDVSGCTPEATSYASWWDSLTDTEREAGLAVRKNRYSP